jgi:chemotaxis protein CheD
MAVNEMDSVKPYFLLPSMLYAERQPLIMQTVLGSCVAVCLYDTLLEFGGMNHFMLPVWNDQGLASAKYGNIATERLIEKMITLGAKQSRMVAKVFGGANQVMHANVYEIGRRNTEIALEVLDRYKITVLKSDLGGTRGRKLLYWTSTNTIHLKYL